MIYVVEDDQGIRELELYALRQAGYEAVGCEDGEHLKKALVKQPPQLVLLDVMLPGEDGLSLLRGIRRDARTRAVPVIMVTAKGEEMDKVRGLDSGADDYISKPFGVMELLSRVKAVLRRSAASVREEAPIAIGELTLDAGRHTVTACGQPVTLTHKEFELLKYMMGHPGVVLTRDTLLDKVWDLEFLGDTRTVDVHIRTLRLKLGVCGGMIATVRGVGYRLEG